MQTFAEAGSGSSIRLAVAQALRVDGGQVAVTAPDGTRQQGSTGQVSAAGTNCHRISAR